MHIHILTIFPQMFDGFFNDSIIKRAVDKKLVKISLYNFREYGIKSGIRKEVDDYAFGGGAGMVMRIEPIVKCLEDIQKEVKLDEIIFLTPDGKKFEQSIANELSLNKNIALLCGRYKGIDQRIRDNFVTKEISIGDYVLSGGELAAAVLSDAIIRLIPGVLSNESSALLDSFQGELLDAPVYTRPEKFRDMNVPDVLLSGDHKKIEEWRYQKALEKTKKQRPDIYNKL
ncbi:MAG: tRNA (guanosine(37)-N1)-methyltransferase TrmD [Bacteroidota bacterium]|nr:tRNA (guanosine(37)-N1)-methyltransferase TrmD [Bacteroidota bacterium]